MISIVKQNKENRQDRPNEPKSDLRLTPYSNYTHIYDMVVLLNPGLLAKMRGALRSISVSRVRRFSVPISVIFL
jgi:hypothetical protein